MRSALKKMITVAGVMLAAAVPMMAQSAVEKGSFGITLPAGFPDFTKQVQKTDSPEGTIETTNWISRAAQSGEAVVVSVSKMPGRILKPQTTMQSSRDSLLRTLKATLESETKTEGQMPSALLRFRSEGAFLQSKLVVDGDRLFQVLYVGRSPEQRAAPAVEQTFASFRVIARSAPEKTAAGSAPLAGTQQ